MKRARLRPCALAAALATVLAPTGAPALSLNAEGMGQALIYPYYTVQSSAGNAFNTYLSVVNHTAQAKALRVRARESRNSREVASFNLYLAPNDVWTAAIVPGNLPAPVLLTLDKSCTSPALRPMGVATSLAFTSTFYTGAFADGLGEGLDRAREGWIEVIEMATVTGTWANAVTHSASGVPSNCSVVQGTGLPDISAPTGGLSGTLTLINVANGMDFTVNAEALANLSTRAFFRPPADAYPDLNAAEIDPVSTVVAAGATYVSRWNRPVDAVSAVLMRSALLGEYVLDAGTRSKTEWAITLPTRHHYVTGSTATPPFTRPAQWSSTCVSGTVILGERLDVRYGDREGVTRTVGTLDPFAGLSPFGPILCGAVSVLDVRSLLPSPYEQSSVTGSRTVLPVAVASGFIHGWMSATPPNTQPMVSLASSTRTSHASGATTTGAHTFAGLPMVGFFLRTFENGTIACSSGTCQGNYGGSFPLKFRRAITPDR
jgi:hypothetical protein